MPSKRSRTARMSQKRGLAGWPRFATRRSRIKTIRHAAVAARYANAVNQPIGVGSPMPKCQLPFSVAASCHGGFTRLTLGFELFDSGRTTASTRVRLPPRTCPDCLVPRGGSARAGIRNLTDLERSPLHTRRGLPRYVQARRRRLRGLE